MVLNFLVDRLHLLAAWQQGQFMMEILSVKDFLGIAYEIN